MRLARLTGPSRRSRRLEGSVSGILSRAAHMRPMGHPGPGRAQMTRPILAVLVAATAFASTVPAAEAMRRGDNAVSQSRAKLEKEWRRARAAGGYSDPLSALVGLFRGAPPRHGTVQPSFTGSTAVDADNIR